MDPNASSNPDSVGRGFGIGCLAMFLGMVACVALGALAGVVFGSLGTSPDSSGPMAMVLWLVLAGIATLPLVAPIVVAVRLRKRGQPQAAKGVFMALLSTFALGLLLVGGCFGLLSTADFR